MTLGGLATSVLVAGPLIEDEFRVHVETARQLLPQQRADLALVFVSPPLVPHLDEILEIVQVHGRARHLIGCTAHGVIGQTEEVENGAAVSVLLVSLPGGSITPFRIGADDVAHLGTPEEWQARSGIAARGSRGWLVFGDPHTLDAERWLHAWNRAYPGITTAGGLAGGDPETGTTRLFLDRETFEDGAVAISVGGSVFLEAIVSQGCTPIGHPWTITSADRNFIRRIGNLPALTVLQDTFNALPDPEKARANGNIFVGLAVDEYREEHRRGDFLVRNLLGADPTQGVVAVGAHVRVGQTVQFQFRDATAATEDLSTLLDAAKKRLTHQRIVASCLCSCAGRGRGLFGERHHDTRIVHQLLGARLPHAGFFASGEIGPVGPRVHLHGYTASLALFVMDGHADS